jgi:hypothetical protein
MVPGWISSFPDACGIGNMFCLKTSTLFSAQTVSRRGHPAGSYRMETIAALVARAHSNRPEERVTPTIESAAPGYHRAWSVALGSARVVVFAAGRRGGSRWRIWRSACSAVSWYTLKHGQEAVHPIRRQAGSQLGHLPLERHPGQVRRDRVSARREGRHRAGDQGVHDPPAAPGPAGHSAAGLSVGSATE